MNIIICQRSWDENKIEENLEWQENDTAFWVSLETGNEETQ